MISLTNNYKMGAVGQSEVIMPLKINKTIYGAGNTVLQWFRALNLNLDGPSRC
jgi:hypothetical protein